MRYGVIRAVTNKKEHLKNKNHY